MIRVSPEAVVFSARLPGSRTIWQTFVEVRGERVPYCVESDDPAATELLVAAKLRTVLRAEIGEYSPRIEPDPTPTGPPPTQPRPAPRHPPPQASLAPVLWVVAIVFIVLKACV